jgi:hypothetical protein
VVLLLLGRRRRGALALVAIGLLGLLCGCGERRQPPGGPPPEPPRNVTDLVGLAGEECGSPLMVWATRPDATRFCIDRFEAGVDDGALGNPHQGSDDVDTTTDGSTLARATVALGARPAVSLTWYQAVAACANAGKRLCTLVEWQAACRGPQAWVYPYGDAILDDACQGFFAYPVARPEVTGSLATCVSPIGTYDMSGNVEEWVAASTPRTPGTTLLNDRMVRGGSYKSNSNALACIGDEFHEAPGQADADRGFRCCADGPIP